MDNLTGKPKQLVVQPAKIVIEQDHTGQFKLTHNIIKPMFLVGILTTTLNNVVNALIAEDQMIVGAPKIKMATPDGEIPEPEKPKVQ